jgi:hypothetical protein
MPYSFLPVGFLNVYIKEMKCSRFCAAHRVRQTDQCLLFTGLAGSDLYHGRDSWNLPNSITVCQDKSMDSDGKVGLVEKIHVECYSGYRGEQTPIRFRLETRIVGVRKVLDQWLAPDHRYFKLLGDDGGEYILRHDPFAGRWELIFFKRETN